jgi:type I restriction enzyme S subunit
MNVLLSIKPKYVELIKAGFKKYEFRRKISKKFDGSKVYIYSTSPIKKIIGVFDVKNYVDPPQSGMLVEFWNI